MAPEFQSIKELSLIQPERVVYPNGLEAFIFRAGDLDLLKLEFVFTNRFEAHENPLLNTALSAMLKEGTTTMTSAQIADKIDYYGAYLVPEYSFDHTALTLYTMPKYLDKVLPVVTEILTNCVFPQLELDTYIRNNIQSLQISLQKNDFIARRLFYQNIFGANRYGVIPTVENYKTVNRTDLLALFQAQIQPKNCKLFIAGHASDEVLHKIAEVFGRDWLGTRTFTDEKPILIPQVDGRMIIEQRDDSLQSAIRMGCTMVNRTHVDFPAVQFVNTLLGGFFGSRLMRNIREEKGYTYSIGSAIGNLKHGGFFTIASEVGVDVTKATLVEIEKEFRNLGDTLTSEEEIDLVRNYLLGVMLGSVESIFSHVDKFKATYFSGLDLNYYDHYTQVIQNITPIQLQEIAQRYFDYDKLVKIVVGKCN